MALGLTEPLTELSTRNISLGVKRPVCRTYHLHVPFVLNSGSLNLLEPSGTLQACNGIALPLYVHLCKRFAWIATSVVVGGTSYRKVSLWTGNQATIRIGCILVKFGRLVMYHYYDNVWGMN
jgi:hypothetical protein